MDFIITIFRKALFLVLAPIYVFMAVFLALTHEWWTKLWD